MPLTHLKLSRTNFSWADLFSADKLALLHVDFLAYLEKGSPDVSSRFAKYRTSGGSGFSVEEISQILVDTAPFVSTFLADLFSVQSERRGRIDFVAKLGPIFVLKEQFIKKRVVKRGRVTFDGAKHAAAVRIFSALSIDDTENELSVATKVEALIGVEQTIRRKEPLSDTQRDLLTSLRNCVDGSDEKAIVGQTLEIIETDIAMRFESLRSNGWLSLRVPDDLDFENLVQLRRPDAKLPESIEGPLSHRRHRDGFTLSDPRMSLEQVQGEVEYCLYCHGRDKDSCSKGLRDKEGGIKSNPLGVKLGGCPLGEKISEAHWLQHHGDSIAALATIMVDNPMLPGTGHRICNDCMKACVFQKQEPVNIPQIETRILAEVLNLPWGVEIYGLLTRWNPLNIKRPYTLPYHGHNVLVVGLGPAGYTLVHYLLNEGFGVVGIDGLKIEPLADDILNGPIRDVRDLQSALERRTTYGFGGVSEYGITVRWDKNFLTLIYLTLARRRYAQFFGGVRFGGTFELEDAWSYGFHHVAIAAGAGKPTIIDLENNLLPGIRKASDFLMGLQLTGAYKDNNLANLQVRLPAVVVGGGLTAIDTATEIRAYYVVQVQKILERFEKLLAAGFAEQLRQRLNPAEMQLLEEMLEHGRQIRSEKRKADSEKREPKFDDLIDSWGGVSLAYRKKMSDSPAYRLNHEEIVKALEEGIRFVENMNPKAALPDEGGWLKALRFERGDGTPIEISARTLCVAAGTSPNTIYEKENPGVFKLNAKGFFATHQAMRNSDGRVQMQPAEGFFTSYCDTEGHTVSYYGDNHPKYAGSVVRAMASAKDGYPHVVTLFEQAIQLALTEPQAQRDNSWNGLRDRLRAELQAKVIRVTRLTNTIVEVVIHAPLQTRKFEPGQFYRLQNFESHATVIEGTKLLMEGIALTGAWVDKEKGHLSLIVLEMGASSRLCATLKPGEPIVVMGPTGAPTEIPQDETVLLAGGGLGNAVLFSIAKALKDRGNKVVYFAGYKNPNDIFKQNEVEQNTDEVIWSSDVGPAIPARRPQDKSFVGNIVQSMLAYAKGDLGEARFDLRTVDRIIAIGSDRMMAAVGAARHSVLQPYLKKEHVAVGSINSPMQCMMKEVCAQCLQKHVDPQTGQLKEIVFSCFNQDQLLDEVDWKNLNDRLKQNTLQEKLTNVYLDYLLSKQPDMNRV